MSQISLQSRLYQIVKYHRMTYYCNRKTKTITTPTIDFDFVLLYLWRNGVVVRASASQSVDLGFIPFIVSYQKTLKNGIHSFAAWRSAFREGCGEQAGKFACCALGQDT